MSSGYQPAPSGSLGTPPSEGRGMGWVLRLPRWEYLTINAERADDYELNGYGDKGWELVATAPSIVGRPLRYVFKRAL